MLISKDDLNEIDIDLSYLKRTFNQEIEYLRKHIDICAETTEKQSKLIENELLAKIEAEPDKESEINSLFETRIRTLNCHFFHSSILLIYANLENFLTSICTNIEKQTESPLLVRNIRERTDILKFKSFFSITSDIGVLLDEFPKFDNYRLLRNAIAHNNSKIRMQNEYKKIKREFTEGIEFEDSTSGFYIETKEFPLELLNKVNHFILSICVKIEEQKYISFREQTNENE